MSKYLIQDIIPPEKKRRQMTEEGLDDEGEVAPPVSPLRRTKREKSTPRGGSVVPDPRTMIADQVAGGAIENVSREESRGTIDASTQERKVPVLALWSDNTTPHDQKPPTFSKDVPPHLDTYKGMGGGGGWRSSWLPWIIGAGIVAILGFVLLNFFSGATVTILPKHDVIPLDQKFLALKSGAAGGLPYAVMIETASSSLEVAATGEKTVTTKSSGKIIVYNAQAIPQRLIKNTRFQSSSGKIYRINESINVPKATVKGGVAAPGFLEVTVYADEAGPEYNSDPTDFTLPGLKDSPIFKKIYARSHGALSGGASGVVKTVSDQDLRQASEDLRVTLETKLRAKARGDLAPSQIVYDQGIAVSFGGVALLNKPASSDRKAIVNAEGTISLVTFKRVELIQAIVKALVPTYKGEEVDIKNLESLQFGMDPQMVGALVASDKLDFTLKGTPELAWAVNNDAVKKALLGVSKDNFNEILSQYPSILRAKATIRPMWKHTFPQDPNRISVVLVDKLTE